MTMTECKMTTENQIAIAEACGYTRVGTGYYWEGEVKRHWNYSTIYGDYPKTGAVDCKIDYNSLDSMQSAVLAQDEEFQKCFHARLIRKVWTIESKQPHELYIHQLTVTDWQESFVETLKQLGRFPLTK